MVSARGHQRALLARARGDDLGRMGGRQRRPGSGVRRAVARLAERRWTDHRPDEPGRGRPQDRPRLKAPPRERLERGRDRAHGAAPVPLPVPVLRGRRPPVLPGVPAQRRRVPGRTVQYRKLRLADDDAGPGHGPCAGRSHPHARGRTPLSQSPGPGPNAARTQPLPLPRMRLNPEVQSLFDFSAGDFTLEDYRHHPPIAAPIAV